MTAILNESLPAEQAERALAPRMPGLKPVELADWIQVSDSYAAQMAQKRALIAHSAELVVAEGDGVAGREILGQLLELLTVRPDFTVEKETVLCPDGVEVVINRDAPLATLGQILQEDICLLQPQDGIYYLSAAVLCFPASWTLSEKLNQALLGIHGPVASYTEDLAKRVQRLFDAIRAEAPMWRANALFYDDPELFHPRRENEGRTVETAKPPYLRSERQTLVRLKESGAVAFSIHTYMVARPKIDAEILAQLDARKD